MLKEGSFIRAQGYDFTDVLTGEKYAALGINYFPENMGWAPKIWSRFNEETFKKDFEILSEMRVNTIRVFLSLSHAIPNEEQLSEEYFSKVGRFLDIAREYDIRVIFSGLNSWEGWPAWAEPLLTGQNRGEYFTDETVLHNLELWYKEFGRRFKDHPALFSLDLLNEPCIEWHTPTREQGFRKYLYEKYKSISALNSALKTSFQSFDEIPVPEADEPNRDMLYQYMMFKNQISYDFSKRMISAFKTYDKNHMVTVGCHQSTVPFDGPRYFGFDPQVIGELFDYISLHWYPYDERIEIPSAPGNLERCINTVCSLLKYMDIGKPVVLEEFGCYGGGSAPKVFWRKEFPYISEQQQADYTLGVIERAAPYCSGFLNWGYIDCADWGDATRFQGLFHEDHTKKELGIRWPDALKNAEQVIKGPKKAPQKTITLSLKRLVTEPEYTRSLAEEFYDMNTDIEDYSLKIIKE